MPATACDLEPLSASAASDRARDAYSMHGRKTHFARCTRSINETRYTGSAQHRVNYPLRRKQLIYHRCIKILQDFRTAKFNSIAKRNDYDAYIK